MDSGSVRKTEQVFLIRRHSFLPSDCDSGVTERQLRKTDRAYTVCDYIELIVSKGIFIVNAVQIGERFKFLYPGGL